jgi:hypothetical protein
MNQLGSFRRKIIYLALAGVLLIPLSMVGLPLTRDVETGMAGGVLSHLREDHDLSPAELSEIDPASETMKLASLGLRGLAVNLLWMKAIQAKDEKEFDIFESTLNALVKIQPTFIKVWEYQAHNLSYNVAVEFDDYEQRYHWIKKGIHFLTDGIPHNRKDHRIFDNLGMFTGHKFGRADERIQYRALFREDDLFHDEMSQYVDIDQVNTPHGMDNWLLAYLFYDRSVRLVEEEQALQHRKDMMFYQYKPAQLRSMGLSMHAEVRSDEFAQANWRRAHREWLEYGNRPLRPEGDTNRTPVTLESLTQSIQTVQELREDLDKLSPGTRSQLLSEQLSQLRPEDRELLSRPVDSLDDEELERYRDFEDVLYRSRDIDQEVADQVADADRRKAEELLGQIREQQYRIRLSEYFRDTLNYGQWRDHALVEATDAGIEARQMQFDAGMLMQRSILDEYTERNPVTGEVVTLPGAIQKLEGAYEIWADLFAEYPHLRTGPMGDDVIDTMQGFGGYTVLRQAAGLDYWPDDFPLQDLVDHRAETITRFEDGLPTSEDLEQRRGDRVFSRVRLPDRPDISFEPPTEDGDDNGE